MSLQDIFKDIGNRLRAGKETEITRETLAKIVMPLAKMKGEEYSDNNEKLLELYRDLSDWVRIGFHYDKPEGELYEGLQAALKHMDARISASDGHEQTIWFDHAKMDALREGLCQIGYAARMLESSSKLQGKSRQIPDRHGNILNVPFIEIYNRPNESHLIASYKLKDIEKNLSRFFRGQPINEPTIRIAPK